MEIKELAVGAVVIIGGVAYTVGGGLGDALDEDVKYISEVSYDNRAVYMGEIADKFSENFSTYIVQTEAYDFVGYSKFNYSIETGTFVEVVSSEEVVDSKNKTALQTRMGEDDFCTQDEMVLFTDKGWNYSFEIKDQQGALIYSITCQPVDNGIPELRRVS